MSVAEGDAFARARECLEGIVGFLGASEAGALEHGELEDRLATDGRALLRQLFQDHLDLRAEREVRVNDVVDADGIRRGAVEPEHRRTLTTVFGDVIVTRFAYRSRGRENLHVADAALNLPEERHSHGLRRLAATEASRGSFDDATETVRASTAARLGKRQVEQLARRAAADFDAFYDVSVRPPAERGDVLILSADGKGIVMRPNALRRATAEAANKASPKLTTRLSKDEKRNRKRIAEVGAVYDVTPLARTPDDILVSSCDNTPAPAPAAAPAAKNKWLTASVVEDAARVVATLFDEAERRDPAHERTWVALIDANNHQIDRIQAEAKARSIVIHILVDFIHVLEYLWSAAWSFYHEGDEQAERWVHDKALAVLRGHATTVAAAIRRKATCLRLEAPQRANADRCADYLLNKAEHLDYPTALEQGWPIATGVIEGACRHLVKDRMDITGARWGLAGAEAVLKLRALRANGDLSSYWHYHLTQDRRRVHERRYINQAIPRAA